MAKQLEVRKIRDGEGQDVYGVYRIGEKDPVVVWDQRKRAEADMADLEKAIAEDAQR